MTIICGNQLTGNTFLFRLLLFLEARARCRLSETNNHGITHQGLPHRHQTNPGCAKTVIHLHTIGRAQTRQARFSPTQVSISKYISMTLFRSSSTVVYFSDYTIVFYRYVFSLLIQ